MKKVLSFTILMILILFTLTGCGENENKNTAKKTNTVKSSQNTGEKTNKVNVNELDYEGYAKKQMELPNEGDEIAIMHVKDYGDVYMRFFPDVAPKAVENFVKHSKDGYYNGLTFHRVIDEFMIQGGDPKGDGTGGESIWKKGFGTELDYSLVPYRGSLCMAMSSLPNSIGSQFFITQAHYDEAMGQILTSSNYPTKLIEQYKQYGGYLSLYMQYTVFGQVYEGMDVVDKIASVDTNSNDKPTTDVVIESIEITTYKK